MQDARLRRALGRDRASRYGVADPKKRIFRYGVQVNSLGLTEQQPENNVHRILIEMLAVTLSKKARARAVQLPAWNEALGLPRPWDQQWSLRMQQILAFETDLLEYDDIFDGSEVIEAKVEALKEAARAELARIDAMGGAVAAVETGALKRALVESNAKRLAAIEAGEQVVVGVNRFTEGEPSPLTAGEATVLTVPETVEMEAVAQHPRLAGPARDAGGRRARARRARSGCARGPQHHAGLDRLRQGGRHHGRMGRDAAPRLRRIPRADRRHPGDRRPPARTPDIRLMVADLAEKLGERRASSSASPGSTGTRTAPSRSRCGPATSAWR